MGSTTTDRPLRLDGYIRQSRTEGKGELSEKLQEEKIRQWIELHDHKLGQVFRELNVSGGKLDRPELQKAMRRIEDGESDGLVVYNTSRFSRSLSNTVALIQRIRDRGALFASVSEQFDLTTWQGRMVFNILQSIAEGERERQTEVWYYSRRDAATEGVHMGPTPFGYVRHGERDENGRLRPNQNPPMEVDPVNGPAVTEIFRRRTAGESWYRISRALLARGVVSPNDKPLPPRQLKRICENDVYLGTITDGVSGVKTEDAHPPLIDYATWLAAQYASGVQATEKEAETVLNGLCRCASCRYGMYLQRHSQNGGFLRYGCNRHRHVGDCPDPALILAKETGRKRYLDKVAARKAARMVEEDGCKRADVAKEFGVTVHAIDDWRRLWNAGELDGGQDHRGLDDYAIEKVFERLPEIAMRRLEDSSSRLDELKAELDSAAIRLNEHATDSELEDAIGRDAYLARGRVLREAAEAAETAYNEELQRSSGGVEEAVRRLREDAESLTPVEWRQFLSQLIRCVFVKPTIKKHSQEPISTDRVHIVWFDDPEVDVPRKGRRDYVMRPFEFPGMNADPGAALAAS